MKSIKKLPICCGVEMIHTREYSSSYNPQTGEYGIEATCNICKRYTGVFSSERVETYKERTK